MQVIPHILPSGVSLRRFPTRRGFTLVELLVVVLIIAVLVAIAVPTFLGQRARAQDRDAQSSLKTSFTQSRAAAVTPQGYVLPGPDGVGLAAALESGEGAYTFTTGESTGPHVVSVARLSDHGVILVSLSDSGTCWLLYDNLDDQLFYGFDPTPDPCDADEYDEDDITDDSWNGTTIEDPGGTGGPGDPGPGGFACQDIFVDVYMDDSWVTAKLHTGCTFPAGYEDIDNDPAQYGIVYSGDDSLLNHVDDVETWDLEDLGWVTFYPDDDPLTYCGNTDTYPYEVELPTSEVAGGNVIINYQCDLSPIYLVAYDTDTTPDGAVAAVALETVNEVDPLGTLAPGVWTVEIATPAGGAEAWSDVSALHEDDFAAAPWPHAPTEPAAYYYATGVATYDSDAATTRESVRFIATPGEFDENYPRMYLAAFQSGPGVVDPVICPNSTPTYLGSALIRVSDGVDQVQRTIHFACNVGGNWWDEIPWTST